MLKIKHFVTANRLIAAIFAIVMMFSVTFAAGFFLNEGKNSCVFSEKTYYFSDASHSSVIGYSGYLCDGTFVKSGKTSRYKDTLYCDCFENTK
jgi:hypothetical protein